MCDHDHGLALGEIIYLNTFRESLKLSCLIELVFDLYLSEYSTYFDYLALQFRELLLSPREQRFWFLLDFDAAGSLSRPRENYCNENVPT